MKHLRNWWDRVVNRLRRRRRQSPGWVPVAQAILPRGSVLTELNPRRGYVIQFQRVTSTQECECLARVWSEMASEGLVGPLILLPKGVTFGEMEGQDARMG